ncbi:MAG: hypothetical protein JXB49_08365 [Bacteroidales bacterium]|nr:hypothetical protein [Bacteroidales bacterium]
MQGIKILRDTLDRLCDYDHYLFSSSDFKSLFPEMGEQSFKTLLSRAQAGGVLKRVCRGIYLYDRKGFPGGEVLFHTASRLRANHFNYLSLESVLSEEGIISQIPINRITLMSSGRSNIIDCGRWGAIEFIHTRKKPENLIGRLKYDKKRRLWKAQNDLALEDLKAVGRNLDLIDRERIYDTF